MTAMTKVIAQWIVLVAFAGAAFAQPGSGAAPAGAATPPAAGAAMAGSAATDAASADRPPAMAAAVPVSDARKACADAMNADPKFAAAIVKVADEKAAE